MPRLGACLFAIYGDIGETVFHPMPLTVVHALIKLVHAVNLTFACVAVVVEDSAVTHIDGGACRPAGGQRGHLRHGNRTGQDHPA